MSIYYCEWHDCYHDNDYIHCNESVTMCEEGEEESLEGVEMPEEVKPIHYITFAVLVVGLLSFMLIFGLEG